MMFSVGDIVEGRNSRKIYKLRYKYGESTWKADELISDDMYYVSEANLILLEKSKNAPFQGEVEFEIENV